MYVPFDQLDDSSRIWIFQADRHLSAVEIEQIDKILNQFTNQWAAHNVSLKSSYRILNNIHIIIGVDAAANQATGCSIDALTHQIQHLGKEIEVDFFNRTNVAVQMENEVIIYNFSELKEAVNQGIISPSAKIYNNLIDVKGKLEDEWLIEADKSWLHRYFTKQRATT